MSSTFFYYARNTTQMCSDRAERRFSMPRAQRMAMACAMGSMSAAYPKVVKTGVVTPVSLFATLVSVVVLVGNLISLLLTGLTSLVGLARLVRLKTTLATRTAMGD